jgi:hypothetical protein
VEHAHVHLVPAPFDVLGALSAVAAWMPVREDRGQLLAVTNGEEYLYYESPAGERLVATTRAGFPSQVLRRVFAETLGPDIAWNWRLELAVDRVCATIEMFCQPEVLVPISAC